MTKTWSKIGQFAGGRFEVFRSGCFIIEVDNDYFYGEEPDRRHFRVLANNRKGGAAKSFDDEKQVKAYIKENSR